jgi:rubrerythrin
MEVVQMKKNEKDYTCALCGHTASGKFVGDICPNCGLTYWKCGNCGFTFTAATLPEACPGCGAKCDFRNVTCYIPECGGPGHIDPRLLGKE